MCWALPGSVRGKGMRRRDSCPHGAFKLLGEVNLPFRKQLQTMQDGANPEKRGSKRQQPLKLIAQLKDASRFRTHVKIVKAAILPFRKKFPVGVRVWVACRLGGTLSWGCHRNQHSVAKWLLFQKLVSEWRGLPGTSEPFPMETVF